MRVIASQRGLCLSRHFKLKGRETVFAPFSRPVQIKELLLAGILQQLNYIRQSKKNPHWFACPGQLAPPVVLPQKCPPVLTKARQGSAATCTCRANNSRRITEACNSPCRIADAAIVIQLPHWAINACSTLPIRQKWTILDRQPGSFTEHLPIDRNRSVTILKECRAMHIACTDRALCRRILVSERR